jgi:hypothetical protein
MAEAVGLGQEGAAREARLARLMESAAKPGPRAIDDPATSRAKIVATLTALARLGHLSATDDGARYWLPRRMRLQPMATSGLALNEPHHPREAYTQR